MEAANPQQQAETDLQDPPSGGWPQTLPETANLPEGSSLYDGPPDAKCRVIHADGRRCAGTRMKAYGLCGGHAGQTVVSRSPQEMSKLGNQERRRRASVRATLGISGRRAASPVAAARVAAQRRAEDYARAIVDDPLDDASLKSTQRQAAAIAALDLLFPEVRSTVEIDLPESADEVAGLGWEQLQHLASRLLDPQLEQLTVEAQPQ